MSEELDPQFTTCLIKKSKHYFRKELESLGIIALVVGCILFFILGMSWLGSSFKLEDYKIYIIILLDLGIFGGIALMCALESHDFWLTFIKLYFKLHVLVIIFLCLIGLEFICFAGIPIMSMALMWMIFSEVLGFGIVGGIIGGIATGIIISPVSYSAFVCFKIDPFINKQWERAVSWL